MGRRDAVEVPRGRLGRPVGRARRRRDRDAGVREPALRARRARAAPRRATTRPRSSTGWSRPTRTASSASSASSTGTGGSATYTGSECMDWAGGARGPVLRGAGEHPRLRGDRRRARRDLRGDRRAAARRAAARLPRAPPRPRAATAADSSPPRCSSSRRTAATPGSPTSLVDLRVDDHPAPDRGAHAPVRDPQGALRQDADARSGSTSTRTSRPSSPSGSARSVTTRALEQAFVAWAGTENLEERVDGSTGSTRSCSRSCGSR